MCMVPRFWCAWLLAAGVALAAARAAVVRANDQKWTPEYAFKVKRVSTVVVSPDGSRAAFVVGTPTTEGEKSEWVSQVHVARSDGTGAVQLTRGETTANTPAWSPDGKWLAFLSARGPKKDGKDPKTNLWRIPVDGGEAEALTAEKGGVAAFRWSPDGKSIAFLMPDARTEDEEKADKEKRDARVVDADLKMIRLYVVPVAADAEGRRTVRKLTGDTSLGDLGGPGPFEWSPDSRSIAFTHQPTPLINDWPLSDVSVVDVATASVRPLAATRAAESNPRYSRDGRSIAYEVSGEPPPGAAARGSRSCLPPAALPACWPPRRTSNPTSWAGCPTAGSSSARRTARSAGSSRSLRIGARRSP